MLSKIYSDLTESKKDFKKFFKVSGVGKDINSSILMEKEAYAPGFNKRIHTEYGVGFKFFIGFEVKATMEQKRKK